MAECCNEKWKFRGEGNACLVLTNTKEKTAYRLAKAKHWGKGHLYTTATNKVDRIHEEMQLVVDYMRDVMRPLLSPAFVVLPELRLTHGEVPKEAELHIRDSRPAQRKGREVEHTTIDPTTLSALVMPDLCYVRDVPNQEQLSSPTISIEIKPKKAFMHVQDMLTVTSEEKSQVCKFCMHQRLKAKEGQWPETSRYCPLDLFSGNEQRMKQALLALAETPQNNLRICQDGEEIHGAWNKGSLNEVLENFIGSSRNSITNGVHKHYKVLHEFLDLVLEALLYTPEDGDDLHADLLPPSPANVQYCQNSCCRPNVDGFNELCDLPNGCVLERILSSQCIDSLDIDGVFPIYLQLEKHLKDSPILRHEYCLDGPYTEGDWLQACSESCCDNTQDLIIEDTVYSMINKVKRFLVSKTMQDCSIMVALQKVSEHCNKNSVTNCLKDSEGRLYWFSVSVVDLDPKPFCKIPTYHKQDKQIVTAYREAGGETSYNLI